VLDVMAVVREAETVAVVLVESVVAGHGIVVAVGFVGIVIEFVPGLDMTMDNAARAEWRFVVVCSRDLSRLVAVVAENKDSTGSALIGIAAAVAVVAAADLPVDIHTVALFPAAENSSGTEADIGLEKVSLVAEAEGKVARSD